jgi:hypothetical protein
VLGSWVVARRVARRDGGQTGRGGEGRARRGRHEGPDGGGGAGGETVKGGINRGRGVPEGEGGGGWEGVRTKGKGETGSLDHVHMRYVGSSGASSPSSSVESSVLSSSSYSGNPLCRCKTSFLMTILLVH